MPMYLSIHPSTHSLPVIPDRVSGRIGPSGIPRHLSPQQDSPAHSGESQVIPKAIKDVNFLRCILACPPASSITKYSIFYSLYKCEPLCLALTSVPSTGIYAKCKRLTNNLFMEPLFFWLLTINII